MRQKARSDLPLLVNLSAWEAQHSFEAFLVDYLCSSVGYEVRERAVARAFISTNRYNIILDGLDEIPVELRQHFPEELDQFVRGLPSEVGVVVTCRTQEYEELRTTHPAGLGLVQAVEILPLTAGQLDSAFIQLAKRDKGWEMFLSQPGSTAYQRILDLLNNPLFLNLAVAGRLTPHQLLEFDDEQHLRDLVLNSYLDHTLEEQRQYAPAAAHRYLAWIAQFLDGAEVSPFDRKTADSTVFDLASLTPPEPPERYWLTEGLILGLLGGLGSTLSPLWKEFSWEWYWGVSGFRGLFWALLVGPSIVLLWMVLKRWFYQRSALSSRLTIIAWPSTRQQRRDFLSRAGQGLGLTLVGGLGLALLSGLVLNLDAGIRYGPDVNLSWEVLPYLLSGALSNMFQLTLGMSGGLLVLGLFLALIFGLIEIRPVLISYRTPREVSSSSLIAGLVWVIVGLVLGAFLGLFWQAGPKAVVMGVLLGLILGLNHGGWFVLLQQVAFRRLARTGNLPPNPYDFLEWGVEQQIFRRVGGGVRFRHNLIQQHLAKLSEGTYQG